MPEGWTAWVLESEGALRVGRAICVATATGAVVAAALVLANLMRGKVPGLGLLLVPAIPIVAAGQLWGIATLIGRRNRAEGGPPRRRWASIELDPRRFFFAGLPSWQATSLLAVALAGFLIGGHAFEYLGQGGPAPPSRRCRYRLDDHGRYHCVSRSTYVAARDAEQRLAAAFFGSFFLVQFGMAAAELRRRRVTAPHALA
jgi:hypothetical protein